MKFEFEFQRMNERTSWPSSQALFQFTDSEIIPDTSHLIPAITYLRLGDIECQGIEIKTSERRGKIRVKKRRSICYEFM